MTKKASEGAVPVQEIQTPTVIPVRHVMRSVLIIGLVSVCIIIGILFHQLNNPIYPKRVAANAPTPRIVTNRPILPEKKAVTVQPMLTEPESIPTAEPAPSQPTESVRPQDPSPDEFMTPLPKESGPLPLITALRLRDKLALGEPCREDLEALLYTPSSTNRQNLLLEKLMPVCINGNFWNTLESTFRRDKKEALITYYHLNNPMWLAYIKSVMTRVIDIQRIHPTKMRPKDFLAQAQEALIRHRLDEAVSDIQKLPPVLRAHFGVFLKQAEKYLTAQEAIENLILSFDEGRK